jgi:cytidine deaminase
LQSGGDLDAPRPRAGSWTLSAPREGYVAAMDAARLGLAIVEMGGGRKSLGAAIDHSVGLEMLVRIGDRVQRGQPLLNVFASPQARAAALPLLESSMVIGDRQPAGGPLVAEDVRAAAGATSSGPPLRPHPARPPAVDLAQQEELARQALAARKLAYAQYSKFRVGAALLADSGRIYSGANVENASYSLTICAERAAFASAVAAGERRFSMLAVATVGGHAPCGACRQFAAEFQGDLPVLLVDVDRPAERVERRLSELLPARFEHPLPALDQDAGDAGGHEAG